MIEARAAAKRASELDPDLGEAHAALGFLSLYSNWDWSAAERELKRALELGPQDSNVRHAYADYLLVMGELDASLEEARRGRTYDPLYPMSHHVVLYHALMAGQYDEVIVEGRRMLEKFPESAGSHGVIGLSLWALGRYEEARAEFKASWGAESDAYRTFTEGFNRAGPKGAAKALADRLVRIAGVRTDSAVTIAEWYALAGENDSAFQWLETALDARSAFLLHAPVSFQFESLRSDPRFESLMRRIGIPRFVK